VKPAEITLRGAIIGMGGLSSRAIIIAADGSHQENAQSALNALC
jgi:hypothetical protein